MLYPFHVPLYKPQLLQSTNTLTEANAYQDQQNSKLPLFST